MKKFIKLRRRWKRRLRNYDGCWRCGANIYETKMDNQKNGLQLEIGNEVYWTDSGIIGVVLPWREELRIADIAGGTAAYSFCDTDNIKLLPCPLPAEEQLMTRGVKLVGFWVPRNGERYIAENSWSTSGTIIIYTQTASESWNMLDVYGGRRFIVADNTANKPKDDVKQITSLTELQGWLDRCPSDKSNDLLLLTRTMLDDMTLEDVRRLSSTCRSKEIEIIDALLSRIPEVEDE